MRLFNTKNNGGGFDEATIQAVWNKGLIVYGYDPNKFRKDNCGAWISRVEYGNTNSEYGWEIDHVFPVSLGGTDVLINLQPLQWQNNRHKSNNWPKWFCKLKAA